MRTVALIFKAVVLSQAAIPLALLVFGAYVELTKNLVSDLDFVDVLFFTVLFLILGFMASFTSAIIIGLPALILLSYIQRLELKYICLSGVLVPTLLAPLVPTEMFPMYIGLGLPLSLIGAVIVWLYLREKGALTSQGYGHATRTAA